MKLGMKLVALSALVALGLAALLTYPLSSVAQGNDQIAEMLYRNNRGSAFLDQYKFKEAAQEFLAILSANPDVTPVMVNLGIAYFYDQKYEEASATLQKVLDVAPNDMRANYVFGLIYRNQDEVDKAVDTFSRVNREDSLDPSTNYYLGRLFMRQRDYETAISYFRKVIELEPYNASAHYNLATALSRSGNRAEGQAEMKEFKRLQDLFGSTTVGLQYLEQGKYAIAIDEIPEEYLEGYSPPEKAPIRVEFAEVGETSGINFVHGGPGKADIRVKSVVDLEGELVPYMGSGIAFVDYDQDSRLDLYLANAAAKGAKGALYRNRGDGTFEETTSSSGLEFSGKTMQVIWGDYDNDDFPDPYLINYGPNILYHNQGDGTFKEVTTEAGVGDSSWGLGGAYVDYDHDGDLDIFVANFMQVAKKQTIRGTFPEDFAGAGNVLYRNNGNGTFTDVSEESKTAGGASRSTAVIAADLDNSRDVDFYVVNQSAPNQLMNNMRDGTFSSPAGNAADIISSTGLGVAAGDLSRNGFMDLVLSDLVSSRSSVLFNHGNSYFEYAEASSAISSKLKFPVLNMQLFDFDNDGDLDVLALSARLYRGTGGLEASQNFFLFENRNKSFVDVSDRVKLGQFKGLAIRGISIGDYDSDGDLDFAISVNGGRPLLFRNEGGNQNNWLAVKPVGTNSNKYGLGVKAEIRAGSYWGELETFGGQGYLTHHPPVLHFGLGGRKKVDIVRLRWPNGVLQSEIDPPVNQQIELQELDRKGTSCPILYVWNGETYEFQTDFLGGSAYGNLVSPGVYNYPDTDEYVKLNRDRVRLKDGHLAVTMNNHLEEVILFDQLELVAVDHPSEFEIFPDEKLLPGPPYQDFGLFTVSNPRLPVRAVDGSGRSVLEEISRIDRIYPTIPETLPFKGYAGLHELVLDLGSAEEEYSVLIMHAWIDYADSSSNLAASQAGIGLVPPYLQVRDQSGNWVTVIERMGFPAGLPKVMTVDLSGKFLSASREIKIVTNMKIFWDQILVETGEYRTDFELQRLKPASAKLSHKGSARFASPDGRRPNQYFYDEPAPAEWKVHVGAYTRFGDVVPPLELRDDMFVITRSGDQIEAYFDVSQLPKLRVGWVRDYLIFVDGFGKDMDPNSAGPQFLGPLPFHGMSAYPYSDGARYPDTEAHKRYLREWNTRLVERAVPELAVFSADE